MKAAMQFANGVLQINGEIVNQPMETDPTAADMPDLLEELAKANGKTVRGDSDESEALLGEGTNDGSSAEGDTTKQAETVSEQVADAPKAAATKVTAKAAETAATDTASTDTKAAADVKA